VSGDIEDSHTTGTEARETEQMNPRDEGRYRLVLQKRAELRQVVQELDEAAQALEAHAVRDKERFAHRVHELSMLWETSSALQGTMELDRVLRMILVAVTAGQGLGFNRAFLLLLHAETGVLNAELGIGPSDVEDANKIWHELFQRNQSLRDMLESYEASETLEESRTQQITQQLRFNPDERPACVARALETGSTINVAGCHACENHCDVETLLGTNDFAIVPLRIHGRPIGALLVDNFITGKPIAQDELPVLETFAGQASAAIENSQLFKRLGEKVAELEEINRQLKTTTQQLLRAERLSAVGAVMANMAHEVRTPLVAVGGFARELLRDVDLNGQHHEAVHVIVEETKRLEGIVSEALDFVWQTLPDREATDINEAVTHVLGLIELEAELTRVAVDARLASDLPQLFVDPNQIHQVLLDLCRNAIQAMVAGGTLRVETAVEGTDVRISVIDNGGGISDETREHIFDSFFTTKAMGPGLGLPISADIARNHGGKLTLRKTGPMGTTFDLTLPLNLPGERGDRF
jgi:signal transduction histidine kinase